MMHLSFSSPGVFVCNTDTVHMFFIQLLENIIIVTSPLNVVKSKNILYNCCHNLQRSTFYKETYLNIFTVIRYCYSSICRFLKNLKNHNIMFLMRVAYMYCHVGLHREVINCVSYYLFGLHGFA